MANAIEHTNGVHNYRFDIIKLDANYLELFFDTAEHHYRALKTS